LQRLVCLKRFDRLLAEGGEDLLDLWLICHGETTWNSEGRIQGQMDAPLSTLGIRQANALAKRLSGKRFDAIYSSDSGRATQTAGILFSGKNLCLDTRLREIHYGILEGKTRAEFSPEEEMMYTQVRQDPYQRRMIEGENWQDLFTRVNDWLASLPKDGTIAVVTHGGVARAALFLIVGYPKSYEWNVCVDNTSITRLNIFLEQKILVTFNDAAHIESLAQDYDD
jgi:2,3-bisphosphoglycerate-dependent phosphoglycerate mutase